MLSPVLAEHKGWQRKHPPASSAPPGIGPEGEQDVSVQGEPLTHSHRDPPASLPARIQRRGPLLMICAFSSQSVP